MPVQIINFYYVPLHFQTAFVSLFNAGWRSTLSIIDHYHNYGTSPHTPAPELYLAQEEELGRWHTPARAWCSKL